MTDVASLMPVPPSPPSPAPEVTHILDDVFTLCRIPFVHDFMFTPDPVADISILTAPVQKEHAIAARITVSGTEKTASYAHVFDFSTDFFFCSIPAFSVGAVTVGFATIEPAGDASHAAFHELPAGAERVQCNRFVRDDERGVFFLLSENEDTGITEVDCMSHRSTRRRTRVCARFHTAALRKRLRSAKGVLHPDDLAQALTYLNVMYERRACPICRAADKGECGCMLPFVRPSHPLDFRNERCNMRLHTGLYEGGSTVRLYNASLPFVITSLTTKSVITGSTDAKVISRLNKYAVQDRMAILKCNPITISAPDFMDTEKEKLQQQHPEPKLLEYVGERNEGEFATATMPDASFLQDSGGLKSPSFSSFSFGAVVDGPVPLLSGPVGVGTLLMDNFEAEPVTRSGSAQSTKHSESETRVRSSGNSSADEVESGANSATENVNDGTRLPDTRLRERKQAGCSSGTSEQSGVRKMDSKEIKAELRKKRNREAAARSNIKRKIRNETLRRNLKEIHRRAAELRATEKRLREENVRLRVEATKQNFNVSSHLQHIQIART